MTTLYHWTFDPGSRAIRLAVDEKGFVIEERIAAPGDHHEEVQRLLPGAAGPVLVTRIETERVICAGTHAVLEHLEETGSGPRLLPALASERAEVRRIWQWTELEFETQVTSTLLAERLMQWTRRNHVPNSDALRKGAHALRGRLVYLNALAEARPYLAGRTLSLADFVVAGYLSAIDYFGDIGWQSVPDLRDWYSRIKSRPAFRTLLADRLNGVKPAPHYAELDF